MKSNKKTIVLVALLLFVVGLILYFIWSCFRLSPEWVSAIAASISAGAVILAMLQLKATKNIAQLQFEDALEKEYRDLVSGIPTKALLDSDLGAKEYADAFDEFFRYFDLSNRQIELRKNGRIGDSTWDNWRLGIKFNMSQPAFKKAWAEVKIRTEDHAAEFFSELRALEKSAYLHDPKTSKV
jgi:hypothetical protein